MIEMARRQRRRGVNVGAFVTIVIIFTLAIGAMTWAFISKSNEVMNVNQILEAEKTQNQQLKLTIEKMEEQNQVINKQVEELEEKIKELETKALSKAENTKDSKEKVAYLTFDDGPSANTPKILDILKKEDIKATFFVIGNKDQKDLYKRIVDEGHALGNHTYGHEYNKIYKSPNDFFADVEKLNDLLEEATGQRTKLLRFPGGSNNTVSRHAGGKGIMDVMTESAADNGYRYFDWNVDSADASAAKQSKDVIVKSVLNGAGSSNQAVILMHDAPAKTTTVDALPEIIEGLRAKGYTFASLDMDSPKVQF